MNADLLIRRVLKPLVFVACLGPIAWLAWRAGGPGFGPNPAEFLNRFLGDWAIRFLLVALGVTPVRGITGWAGFIRFRRMLGLFAFFYVCLHLTSYIVVDQFFDWPAILKDILKRNFITVGMIAFALLVPLAVTSTKGMVKRLGSARWQKLHRLVYAAGILGCIHYFMMVKGNQPEPLYHGAILAVLLGYRVAVWAGKARRKARAA